MSEGYTVVARLVAEDATGPGATSAGKHIDDVDKKARGAGRSITGFFDRIGTRLAMLAGGYGIGRFIGGMIRVNSELETATSGMATLYSAMTGEGITASLGRARGTLAGLREDARKGVGELQDYIGGFQAILGPGLTAGVGQDKLRALTRNALAAGFALRGQEGLKLAPMDLQQALTAGVGDRTTPIVMQALKAAGVTQAAFNKLDTASKIESLNEAFARFAPGVELMGKSWAAQFSTLQDNLRELFRSVTKPLFDRWKDQLVKVNDWLDHNKDRLADIVNVWGERLVKLWDHLIRQAGTYAAIVAAAAVAPHVPAIGQAAKGAGGRVRGIGSKVWAGIKDPLGFSAMFGGAVGSTGGTTTGIFAMLRGAGAALSKLAWPLALVTTAFLALKGGLSEYPATLAYLGAAWGRLMGALGMLGEAFGMLTGKGSVLNIVGAALAFVLGGIADVVGVVIRGVASLVVGLGVAAGIIGELAKGLFFLGTGQWLKAKDAFTGIVDVATKGNDKLTKIWADWAAPKKAGEDAPETPTPPVPKNDHSVHIGTVNVAVKAEVNEDPARIARGFDEMLQRVNLYRTQVRRLPLPSGSGA